MAPMNLQIEPPEKKRKNMTSPLPPPPPPPSCPSFSLFPDEIFVNCLARISRMYYPTLSIISKSFRSLLSSTELYAARSHIGSTEQCLYVCLSDESYQSPQWFTLCINPNRTLTVSTIKKKKKKKTVGKSLAAIPSSSNFPSTELSMPKCTRPSSAVRILDCRTHTWRDAPSMIVPRNHALTCFYDGKIYVMGGCGELEEPWAEVFDTNTQTWEPLSDPGTEIRNIGSCTFYTIKEIKGKIFFWNPNRTYAYDTSQDNWESYAGSWESTTCLIDGGVEYYYIPKSACEIDGVCVSSCIVSLLPFDGLVSELEKREEEEANGEQQELRRRIREPMSIWDGLPRMQIPMFTERILTIPMVLKEISMRLLAQTTPGSKLFLQKLRTVMNNESKKIIWMFNTECGVIKQVFEASNLSQFSAIQEVIAAMNLQVRVEPPEKKSKRKKKTSPPPSTSPSFSLLPDEIIVSCLALISRAYYPRLSIISKSFRSLLSSKQLYTARSHIGSTEQCLYVCLSDERYQSPQWFTRWINPNLALEKKKKKKTLGKSLAPIPSMIVARNDSLTCFYDGKIYVMGGCGDDDEPWAEVFDIKTQTWERLSDPGKIHFWNSYRAYAYDTSQDNWESMIDGGVWYHCIPKSACEIDGVWYHMSYGRSYDFRWTMEGETWKAVKGLDSLIKMYNRNGGSSCNKTKLVSCCGKLLLLWEGYMKHNPNNRKKIWCAEITLETDDEGEVWGNAEWIDVVKSVPTQCELLNCLVVSV
ncbi:hypothetical protein HID58_029542 [Brassica napus]|uniref:F-box domain-containing protein n=2 Tax=Brassica TaxID=3705 RepID=A0ABQ8CFL2_BRANA|nr:hypothetical protein HID58_029542 [Brassica napus]